MSSNRKSFLLHIDSLNILDDLTDVQAGMLFRAIKSYQLGEEIELDAMVRIAFSPFRNQFTRDSDKYEKLCEKNRLIAENRYKDKPTTGNHKSPKVTKSTTGKTGNHASPTVTKSTDNDSDSKNDSKSDSDSDLKRTMSAKADDVIDAEVVDLGYDHEQPEKKAASNFDVDVFYYWCDVMNKNKFTSKMTPKRMKAIKARLKEGYTLEDIKRSIDGCSKDSFSMGLNDRGKPFNDIELICRTGEKLESFWDAGQPQRFGAKTAQSINNLADWEIDNG